MYCIVRHFIDCSVKYNMYYNIKHYFICINIGLIGWNNECDPYLP